jgi:hypothetical protein
MDLTYGGTRRLQLRELAWTDPRPSLKDAGAYVNLWRGGWLVKYWIPNFARRRMDAASTSLRLWFLCAVLSLLFWYALVLSAA